MSSTARLHVEHFNCYFTFQAISDHLVNYPRISFSGLYFQRFQYNLEKLLEHHKLLVKGNKSKGIEVDKTIPLWPKNTEKTTKKTLKPILISTRKNLVKTDLQHLQSMNTDRAASYTCLDKPNISRFKKRKLKVRKSKSQIGHQRCRSIHF